MPTTVNIDLPSDSRWAGPKTLDLPSDSEWVPPGTLSLPSDVEYAYITGTSLSVTPDPAVTSDTIMLAATVVDQTGATVNGVTHPSTVSFYKDAVILGTSSVNALGVATLTVGPFSSGTYLMEATYNGTVGLVSSDSSPVMLIVTNPAPGDEGGGTGSRLLSLKPLCKVEIICPGSDFPILNLSSEAPDPFLFTALSFGPIFDNPGLDPIPPHPPGPCIGVATSPLSQEDADLSAAQLSAECVVGDPPEFPPGTPGILLFGNQECCQNARCSDGSLFTYCLAAQRTFWPTQLQADRYACTLAEYRARQHRLCLSDLPPTCCVDQPFSATISAMGNFLAVFPQSNFWELIGDLPPGLTFNGGFLTAPQATITGTPTSSGVFAYAIKVTAPNGDFMQRNYTMTAASATQQELLPDAIIGTPYLYQIPTTGFSNPIVALDSGTMPPGLSIVSTDIAGTPTAAGNFKGYTFVIRITDEATSLECKHKYFINVTSGVGGLRAEFPQLTAPVFDGTNWIVTCDPSVSSIRVAQGKPNSTYAVTFRVRGVVETAGYAGGTALGGYLYLGGFQTFAPGNAYSVVIGTPSATYRLNNGASPATGVVAVDYTFTANIKTGTQVTLMGTSGDSLENANVGHLQANDDDPVHPITSLWPSDNGQFIQLDVINATLGGNPAPEFKLTSM